MSVLTFCGSIITALAYYIICYYLFIKQKEIKRYFIFYISSLFLFLCGTIHLFEAISTWYPKLLSEAILSTLRTVISLGICVVLLINHKKIIGFSTTTTYQEKEFLKQERLMSRVIEVAPIGMASLGLDGKWLSVNQALCKMLGYNEAEFKSTNFQNLTHPDDIERNLDVTKKMISGETDIYQTEKRYRHKDGHYVWGWLNTSFLKNEKGKPLQYISQIVDISERKKAETKLRHSEIMFRGIIEHAPIGKSLLNPNFKWVIVNPSLCKMLGYTKAELLQKNIEDLILPEDKDIGKELMVKLMNKEVAQVRTEKRHLHKNGSIIWIALNASIIWDESAFLYLLIQWADISPLKNKEKAILKFNEQLERKVKERTKELQEANKELENFTYVLTHDLRQPLKNLSNLSSLILEDYADNLDEEDNYMLQLIEKNATKVDNLIIDMLNYTKSSKYNFKKETVDLNTLFYEEFEIGKKSYKQNSISFKIDKLPLVLGDKAALRQVCQNLISNALKYSSKQEKIDIIITYSMQENKAVFSVKDNGIGFDESLSHKIFEVFQRLHKESDYSGTGIGMPITAKIIEKHNGNIWAKSNLGYGATFYFR